MSKTSEPTRAALAITIRMAPDLRRRMESAVFVKRSLSPQTLHPYGLSALIREALEMYIGQIERQTKSRTKPTAPDGGK